MRRVRPCLPVRLVSLFLNNGGAAGERLKNFTESWLGNSFPGAEKWVQQDIHALAVAQPRQPGLDWPYRGYTVDRFKYPDDPRLHLWSAGDGVRMIKNRRFLFVLDMNAEYLQLCRFSSSSKRTRNPKC